MARPSRCRRVCTEPRCRNFAPQSVESVGEIVQTVDEYEVIRLVDCEKQTHEQCAAQMGISRTTVTEICENARFKLADCLVNGKALSISGGHYRICQGDREYGCGRSCRWGNNHAKKTGGFTMRIAVPYENGLVFQHFGHTSQMKLYDTEGGQIVGEQITGTADSGHGALAGFLSGHGVDVLICGGIGGGAQQALAQAGIRLYGGVTGNADDAVRSFLAGALNYSADVHCEHHEHHGRHGHCGEDKHGCSGAGGCGGVL